MKEKIITIIFRRKDTDDKRTVCEPVDVVIGNKISKKNDVYFTNMKYKKIPCISDKYGLNNEYVFAFERSLGKTNNKEIKNILKEVKDDINYFKDYEIVQEVDDEFNLLTYLSNYLFYLLIDPDDYGEIEKIKILSEKVLNSKEFTSKVMQVINPNSNNNSSKEQTLAIFTDELYNNVTKTVICQNEQVKQIVTAVSKNLRIKNPSLKSNILVCGPTGVGKSEIFNTIAKYVDVPITIEDSTEYTAASYKGKDVTEILLHLYKNANSDIEKAQRGIILIDEIDKKASFQGRGETYTSSVIQSLLKMIEGHTYMICETPNDKGFPFDTSFVTFAFAGAFSGIETLVNERKSIGFNSNLDEINNDTSKQYTNETLKKYGLPPEFIGRNDVIVIMNKLEIDDLIKIIKTSNKSQLLLYKEFFKELNIDFTYSEDTINKIAKKAYELGLGARGIKTIVENSIKIANYYALSSTNYTKLELTQETIDNPKKYILQ